MKIVDAYWELRNLGVTTQEVELDKTDSIKEIITSLDSLMAMYQVIKVPTKRFDVYRLLTELGFSFAETMIRVSHDLNEINCNTVTKRVSDSLTFGEMDAKELLIMREHIRGGMFQTDRIILDPFFTSAQAANRYIMWMDDELERGSKMFSYRYKEQPVGFSCIKIEKDRTIYPVLGGVYMFDKPLSIGNAIIYKQLEIGRSIGGKKLYTFISANNATVVRAYSQLGYTFEDIKYVFVKHIYERS